MMGGRMGEKLQINDVVKLEGGFIAEVAGVAPTVLRWLNGEPVPPSVNTEVAEVIGKRPEKCTFSESAAVAERARTDRYFLDLAVERENKRLKREKRIAKKAEKKGNKRETGG